jgi:hypothetical protein|tara:strand:+ start:380 stop:619 length:240 start_codon:yes stop_codon:yes gene_type:complete
MRLQALRAQYVANIGLAKANLDVLLHSAVGIGEHSDVTAEMDKWIGAIANNQDKIEAIDELYDTPEEEQREMFADAKLW